MVLTIVRSLVQLHGGTVSAESKGKGSGSEFVVRLPYAPASESRLLSASMRTIRIRNTSSLRVLVVDDNVDAATSLATVLELAGHEVRTSFSGPDALAAAEAFRPECIVLDLNLPGVDGVEVAPRLRALPWGREVSIIALTGMGQPTDLARTRAAGFDHHMTKPVQPLQVLDALAAKR